MASTLRIVYRLLLLSDISALFQLNPKLATTKLNTPTVNVVESSDSTIHSAILKRLLCTDIKDMKITSS